MTSMTDLQAQTYLTNGDIYLETLFEAYQENPEKVDPSWRAYFDKITKESPSSVSLAEVRDYFKHLARSPVVATAANSGTEAASEIAVANLMEAYRQFGHLHADTDPLGLTPEREVAELSLAYYGLSDADLSRRFQAGASIGMAQASLQDIIEKLRQIYTGHVGYEYQQVLSHVEREWLRAEIEAPQKAFSPETQKRILEKLTAAEGLEKYLGMKYVGQKRFSLEGGDSLLPMLDRILATAAQEGMIETVIGMAHRGRLNVLINLIGKSPSDLFAEFEGKFYDEERTWDVKYHMGFSADIEYRHKPVHVALAFNPSHLEIVSPVVEGSVKARQVKLPEAVNAYAEVLPITIHGDAAMAGQGVVMETFALSQTRGFKTGGSIRIAINNQVGFTMSCIEDARSSDYCTDAAKMIGAPIFHVQGDDPEAVCRVAELATRYRQKFQKDVVIDLVCYRRHGHNEADDPSMTQPRMYQVIKKLPTTRQKYAEQLQATGVIDAAAAEALVKAYEATLDRGEPTVPILASCPRRMAAYDWKIHVGKTLQEKVPTGLALAALTKLADELCVIPEGFTLHPQIAKLLEERRQMTAGKLPLNWGYAEVLAYASLLQEGYSVRLSGEDAGRGTFAHRHVVLHDYQNDATYVPLAKLGKFTVIDSLLSEEATMAFEYGYATASPEALVLWEGQFGDFANGAQVVIDQFMSSGEQKWNRLCGLVLLLPHGYEGMGPEHSSARLERYLQLCAEQNMQVCVPTTPAQIFHLLRRQLKRAARKPLIVMTPKSLLRHKLAVSTLEDLTRGEYQLLIPEGDADILPAKVERVILCSGKVYYDLLQKRREDQLTGVAIVRIEQLYPFPREELSALLKSYTFAKSVIWCQEEPQNQGAWYAINHHLQACLAEGQTLEYAGRAAAASPAVGSSKRHAVEQAALVATALNIKTGEKK